MTAAVAVLAVAVAVTTAGWVRERRRADAFTRQAARTLAGTARALDARGMPGTGQD